jgi:hypothetical protein
MKPFESIKGSIAPSIEGEQINKPAGAWNTLEKFANAAGMPFPSHQREHILRNVSAKGVFSGSVIATRTGFSTGWKGYLSKPGHTSDDKKAIRADAADFARVARLFALAGGAEFVVELN